MPTAHHTSTAPPSPPLCRLQGPHTLLHPSPVDACSCTPMHTPKTTMPHLTVSWHKPRVAGDAIQWLADGHMAVVAAAAVLVYLPAVPALGDKRIRPRQLWSAPVVVTPTTLPDFLDSVEVAEEELLVARYSSDVLPVQAAWSPLGVSPSHSCLMALVTSHQQVWLVDPCTPTAPVLVTQAVMAAAGVAPATTVSQEQMAACQCRSVAWSPEGGFLACGLENGSVCVFSVSDLRVVLRFEVGLLWLTRMWWQGSRLAVAGSDNSVVVLKLARTSEGLAVLGSHQAVAPLAQLVLAAAWVGNDLVVAVSERLVAPHAEAVLPAGVVSSLVVSGSDIAVVMASGQVLGFAYSRGKLSPQTTPDTPSEILAVRMLTWRDGWGNDPRVLVGGCTVSPLGGAAAVWLHAQDNRAVTYLQDSETVLQVEFVGLDPADTSKYSSVVNSSHAWFQQWVLSGGAIETTLAELRSGESDPGVAKPESALGAHLIQALALLSRLQLANVLSSGTHDQELLRRFAAAVVAWCQTRLESVTSPVDVYTHHFYHQVATGTTSPLPTALLVAHGPGDILETFPPGEPLRPAVSEAGHEWPRCALTGLPLMSLNTRQSSWGGHECVAGTEAFEGDGWLAAEIVAAVGVCVYTGGRLQPLVV